MHIDVYPFRARIARMIAENKLPGYVYGHPGYIEMWSKNDLAAHNITIEYLENQIYRYARAMQHAKIVFCTHSAREVAVRKYVEAASAGALVMGNIPHEREEEFRSFMVEIDDYATDQYIIDTVNYWLTHDEERMRKVRAGMQWAQKYTAQAIMQDMIRGLHMFDLGARGLMFTHAFRDVSFRLKHETN